MALVQRGGLSQQVAERVAERVAEKVVERVTRDRMLSDGSPAKLLETGRYQRGGEEAREGSGHGSGEAGFFRRVLAVLLIVLSLALVGTLQRNARLVEEVSELRAEVELARSVRQMERAYAMLTADQKAAAEHASGRGKSGKLSATYECEADDEESCAPQPLADGACKLLCPSSGGGAKKRGRRAAAAGAGAADDDDDAGGKGKGGDGDDGDGDDDDDDDDDGPPPSATMRAMVGALSVAAISAPVLFFRNIDRLPLYKPVKDAPLLPNHKIFSYQVDVWFSTNPYSKLIALAAITGLLVFTGAGLLFAATGANPLVDFLWSSLAGVGLDWTFAGEDEVNVAGRVVALYVSIGGMLVTALLLGIVSDAIGEKMDDLRKGKTDVIESGHTLILGWSDKLLPIVHQLTLANESEGGGVVVILADRDKEEMDAEVADWIDEHCDVKTTTVTCRSGNPLLGGDLAKVAVSTARSIIVLADDGVGAEVSDARVLRIVLSLFAEKEKGGLHGHVVAEVSDLDNEPLIRLVGGDMVETVVSHDVIGRLMLQCARQPGLAYVFENLLGFDGSEFYIKNWPSLAGRTFGEVLRMFPDAVPLGVQREDGKLSLNPPDEYVMGESDELVVLAEDDDSYAPLPEPLELRSGPMPVITMHQAPERVLFCGWRRDMQDLILSLDELVLPGSELWLFCALSEEERLTRFVDGDMDPAKDLKNLTLRHPIGDTVSRRDLEQLPLEHFDSVLILADTEGDDDADATSSDSRSLATLLLIRDIQTGREAAAAEAELAAKRGDGPGAPQARGTSSSFVTQLAATKHTQRCEIISEILDTRTRNLIAETKVCDYVLSNELISMALAMVSEDKNVNRVLSELFTAEGNELYLRPARVYVRKGEDLSFMEVMLRCRQRQEICVGLRTAGSPNYPHAELNPADKLSPREWHDDDMLVILAEDDFN